MFVFVFVLPFDLYVDMFIMNILHDNDIDSHNMGRSSIIHSNNITRIVREQLELGLNEEFEDNSLTIHNNGTFELNDQKHNRKDKIVNRKRKSSSTTENGNTNTNTNTNIKKQNSNTTSNNKHTEIISLDSSSDDDNIQITNTILSPQRKHINSSSSSSSTQQQVQLHQYTYMYDGHEVIDLTIDTSIYDNDIDKINIKEEKLNKLQKLKQQVLSLQQQQQHTQSITSSSSQYTVPSCDRRAAGVLALQEQAKSYMVNLNQATIKDLTRLPGVGRTTAQRIIQYREDRLNKLRQLQQNNDNINIKAFNQPTDLLSVPKVNYPTLDRIRHLVYC